MPARWTRRGEAPQCGIAFIMAWWTIAPGWSLQFAATFLTISWLEAILCAAGMLLRIEFDRRHLLGRIHCEEPRAFQVAGRLGERRQA